MARRTPVEVNAGSMADIAFLLLIFFLVTTKIPNEKGLPILLPPKNTHQENVKVKQKNILTVLVNSNNQLLVEKEPLNIKDLRKTTIDFLENRGSNPQSSDSPQKAVVSIKTDRGTNYNTYMKVMNEVQAAYNTLRAKRMGISLQNYLALDKEKATKKMLDKYKEAKNEYPLRISEAEQSAAGQ
ncbi:biopolymer transporter ExbD [uncultured Microscilla sp.]|uniref:ExbD/TolR family protein n=1 Tax=uncultured Microscilla sp. TaxID=432653 RepID=UPI0026304873|nr:biopolymer transporter ExbD [uncultured Microscilla sp.]